MRTNKIFFSFALIVLIVTPLFSKDYIDKQYKFSIDVPDSWKAKVYMDGTDKVYDFTSSDENAFIQLRSFQAGSSVSMDILVQVFEKNFLLAGNQRQSLENITSTNGIPGKQGSYIAQFKGKQVAVSVFYVIQKGQIYTLMGIVPTSMFQQKQAEIAMILKSFIIPGYQRKVQSQPSQSSKSVGISDNVEDKRTQPPAYTNSSKDQVNLFAGMKAKAASSIDPASIKQDKENETAPKYRTSKYNKNVDNPYDYGAQVRFWADEEASDAKWKELPLKSSLIIRSLSSNKMDWKVYAAGTRKSSAYAAHMMGVSDNDTYAEKNSFCYMLDNKYYAVDDANDIFSLSNKYTWMCGRKGMIMFSNNGGTTWYPMNTPTRENLNSISFANTKNGIAVGNNGTILVTNDGGQQWNKVNSPVSGHLKSVEMTDANVAYILPLKTEYLKGFVLKSTDAGRSWVKKEFPSQFQTSVMMSSLSFMGKDEIWICGILGLVFRSKDGGDSWEYQESARGDYNLEDIHMVTHDEGWACGSKGTLLHTENGGKRWRKVDLGVDYDLYCLEFNGPYMGWVSSRHNIFKLYDDTYGKFYGDFSRKYREPDKKWEIQPVPPDNIYVMKAYERFDFASRSVVPVTESSGYGFYLLPATDKILVMGGLLPTEYTDIYANVPFNLATLYRQSSNKFITVQLNKVNICYAPGAKDQPKLVVLKHQLINENGEQIPQITFKIVYPGEQSTKANATSKISSSGKMESKGG
ncbi:MAG: hypothetical protein JXR65_03580 [Bacteroidales bacterium]|nr:hypothetical protein [Bacteroidales bacterium]